MERLLLSNKLSYNMNKDTPTDNVAKRPNKEDLDSSKTKADVKETHKADVAPKKSTKPGKASTKTKPAVNDGIMTTLGLVGALALIFVLYYVFGSSKPSKHSKLNEETFIKKFNAKKHEYSLKFNEYFHTLSLGQVSELFSATLGDHNKHPSCDAFKLQSVVVPDSYNFYDQHPNCKFNEVQQRTSTGYVEVLTSTFRNRHCALHLGKDFSPSVLQLISCDINKNGVKAGRMDKLLEHVKKNGFVSEKCYAGLSKKDSGCVADEELKKCERHEVANYCKLKDEKYIKREIFMNGPVITTMDLYQDFLLYDRGIYTADKNKKMQGQIFLKIVGWGVDAKKKNEYWLVESNLGKNWGENGVAKIKMHQKGCNIADTVIAVHPRIPDDKTKDK